MNYSFLIVAKSKALTCCIQYDVNNRAKETERFFFVFFLQQQSAVVQVESFSLSCRTERCNAIYLKVKKVDTDINTNEEL